MLWRSLRQLTSFFPSSSLFSGFIAHPVVTIQDADFSSLGTKYYDTIEPWIEQLESLDSKTRMMLMSGALTVLALILFMIFSPLVVILSLVILLEVYMISSVNLKIQAFQKDTKKPVPIRNLRVETQPIDLS